MDQTSQWTLDDIPWHEIDRDRMSVQEELFYLVAAASFVEIVSDLYTSNLTGKFSGDDEVTAWLVRHWENEELQHGRALKRYVQFAWPDFDWDRTYRSFFAEYSTSCRLEALESTRALEMASRCVVEMGTASYYRTLSRLSPDPVLRRLAGHICEDEVRHYKHFYRYFVRYRQSEDPGRVRVLQALWRRLKMIRDDDGFVVFKHLYLARLPGPPVDTAIYRAMLERCRRMAGRHFPHQMSAKMLLKPLGLAPATQRIAQSTVETLCRYLVA
jgi:hypothetical protein